MHDFAYRGGALHAEGVDLARIADEVGTPFYCYSSATLVRQYRRLVDAFAAQGVDALICYAIKANSNQAVLTTLAREGAGFDIVSEGELRRVRAVGASGDKVMFAGVGKTKTEMAAALDAGIHCFNVESEPELHALSEVASARGLRAPISIRVNPNVDAGTHKKITTGTSQNKFGIPLATAREAYRLAATLPGIRIVGVDMHIGSQITELAPFDAAAKVLAGFARELIDGGIPLEHIDLGGGLGIAYRDDAPSASPEAYAEVLARHVKPLGLKVILEMGRFIAGHAGVLVTEVTYVKQGDGRSFVIVDAAMNDLIRPTLYEAHHDIKPLSEPGRDARRIVADVVGPVCESGDFLALNREIAAPQAGERLALMTAGAYGAVQASAYNSRRLVPEVLVAGDRFAVVRPRPSFEDLIALDRLPDWLAG